MCTAGPYDIWASHLVAMTERNDESIFLLDDHGCPTNLNVFPALRKIVTNTTRRLVANFQAFKFAASPVVRFSVLVQFCQRECPPVGKTTLISFRNVSNFCRSIAVTTYIRLVEEKGMYKRIC